ncbi:AAA domain-containing protein [Haliscomenobacter sp.]|uniref:AAA domain-containing protein n=1 Tax=Haliscomenobacter sp. TaxID=2717303 RepID=UPI003364E7CC
MENELQELTDLLELLKIEKKEDFEQHRKLMDSLSPEQRRTKGLAWYPLNVVQQGYTIGERAFVVVERTQGKGQEHQFRSGKTVRFYTQQAGVHNPERNGVIYYVDKDKMRIILNTRDLPDWMSFGQLAVDILFDERTYLEMEKAMQRVISAPKGRLQELRAVFLGLKQPQFLPIEHPIKLIELNPSQNQAVNQILAAQDVVVIHGPPGTGKTTTLVQAIKLLAEREKTVLVTAPSNTAVDLLSEKLAAQDLRVVRIGNISRVDESILRHTLEFQISQHPESKNIKKVKVQAAECRRQANRLRSKRGYEAYEERKRMEQEAAELSSWANSLEQRLIDMILDDAQVIACTLVGAAHPVLDQRKFRTAIVDEAAQALEPATWIPITKASKIVLTGDPFQLPPTVKSNEAAKKGFNITMIEKCLKRIQQVNLLNIQYRMNEVIMGFSNRQFYNNELMAAPGVKEHRLDIEMNAPVIFIDTAGCGFDEKVHHAYQSKYNPEEFQVLREHLYLIAEAFLEKEPPSIAIISPYREQALHIEKELKEDPNVSKLDLSINTIDGFQGQEKDLVFISLVRSNTKGEIGFLTDYRRMNVAMTRARKQLIIVGDSATIGNNKFYGEFLDYCEKHGEYRSAWEYMKS